jgi:polysaccharide chain length determinant protein (PEP-CTERM system associated)
MQDIYDQVLREVRNAWRFRWTGVIVAWLLCVLGWAAVVAMPNIYEARARVFVDSSSVLRPILNDRIVPVQLDTELQYVRQALLGREHLERVVSENNLDSDLSTDGEIEDLLNSLRTDIRIGILDNRNTLYNITYRNSDREKAIGVVRTLLTSLVETTLGAGREDSETAGQFVDARIAEYELRLQTAEDARAEFKKRNATRLPGSEGGYYESIRAESLALDESRKALRLAETRRDRLAAQLSGQSTLTPTADNQGAEPHPNSLDARIRDYRTRLDALLLQYTEKHPDVINAREVLDSLEKQRREQLAELGIVDPDQEVSGLGMNPIYQATRIRLNEIEVEIDALRVDVSDRSHRLNSMQALVDEVPEVEAELARLNRDYDVIYEQYQSLVRSRETQELSRKAADTEEVEFRVIDPPLAEYKPVAPKRVFMLALVFAVALGAGGGSSWLIGQLNPVFSSVSELRLISGLPILGAVTQVTDPHYQRQQRRAWFGFISAIGALVTLFLAGIFIEVMGTGLRILVGFA